MSQQRKGGLGRGLAALIPTGPDEGPRLGNDAADVILGPRGGGPRTTPPRPRSAAGASVQAEKSEKLAASNGPRNAGPSADGSDVSRETAELVDPGAVYREISPAAIEPNPKQPRTYFDEEALAELAHSVKEFGLLQPIVVREVAAGRYQLIMGERRWRASQRAELEAIPAIVRQTDDEDLLRDALLENIHRVQLNPLEEAAAYQQLLEDFQCTQEELATRIGRSRPQVSNTLRLLKLPPLVARRVAAGVLSAGHARALLGLQDGAAMERLAQRIVAEGLSVRSVEEIVTLGGDEDRPTPRKPRAGRRHPQLEDIAAAVADRLDTRVGITLGQRKGKMTIEFASMEDLNRVLDIMGLREAREL